MPRRRRGILPGFPHHVTHRGNRRLDIFREEADYRFYVERNPVRAGIVQRAEYYRWSSAQAHCGLRKDDLLDEDFPPAGLIPDWSLWLQSELSASELKQIRSATHRGIPFASRAFTQELESLLRIRLLPRKRGRPTKPAQ